MNRPDPTDAQAVLVKLLTKSKWTGAVVGVLDVRPPPPFRFTRIFEHIDGINSQVLTTTLRRMVRELLRRTV